MKTVWSELKQKKLDTRKAFTILAPMEDVTDTVFRQVVLAEGRPDLFMTEFTNCDGLDSRGRDKVIHRLSFTPEQQPIVAQIWGRKPETYIKAVPLLIELGFAGIDINMGCPVPKVVKSGAGSGLIREPDLAKEIVLAVRETISKSDKPQMGLSIKTRIGFKTIQPEWVEFVLSLPIDALTLHLRTTKELSKVAAHWELMKDFVKMKEEINKDIVLIGNGDITTKKQLSTYAEVYGVDGLMVGRGIFEDLWLFNSDETKEFTVKKKLEVLKNHITLYESTWGTKKNFEAIKKFFKIYVKDFDHAAELRSKLLRLKTSAEMLQTISDYETTL